MKALLPFALAFGLAACSGGTEVANVATDNVQDVPDITEVPVEDGPLNAGMDEEGGNVTAAALPTDAWVGKWVGVEGLVLDIQPGDGPGKYALAVTLLDGTENYEGTAAGEAISFTRAGKTETIRKASGDDTGLKYLAGKTNCLMIKSGEGFCRG